MSSGTCRIQQRHCRLKIAPREVLAFGLLAFALLNSSASLADDALPYPDWDAASRVKTIRLVTQDASGVSRDDKLWFVVIDGAAYLRTGEPPWLHNLRREANAEVLQQWLSLNSEQIEDFESAKVLLSDGKCQELGSSP